MSRSAKSGSVRYCVDAPHVVVELLAAVRTEVAACDLAIGEVRHQAAEIVDAGVDGAHRARREPRVAAPQGERRPFEQRHVGPGLARSDRRVQGGVATADYDDMGHPTTPRAFKAAMDGSS